MDLEHAEHELFPFPDADWIVLAVYERSVRRGGVVPAGSGRLPGPPRPDRGRRVVRHVSHGDAGAHRRSRCSPARAPASSPARFRATRSPSTTARPEEARRRAEAWEDGQGAARATRRGGRANRRRTRPRARCTAAPISSATSSRACSDARTKIEQVVPGRLALLDPAQRQGRGARGGAARIGSAGVVGGPHPAALRAAGRPRLPDLRVRARARHGAPRHARAAGAHTGLLRVGRADRRRRRRPAQRRRRCRASR